MLDDAKKISQTNWRTVRFGDVVRNVDATIRNPLQIGLERFVGLEHLDAESLHIKRWGNVADGTSFSRKFERGQVLFGKRRAYQRKAAVADFDGICSGDILVFEPNGDELLPELLPFVVQSDGFFEHALGTSAGSLSPRTKWSDLARYEFALPPKDEQRRIAEILKTADEATEKFNDSLVNLQTLKNVTINKIFSENDWQKTTLGEVCKVVGGGTPSTSNQTYWNGEILWVTPSDVTAIDDLIIRKTERRISSEGLQNSAATLIPAGSVLMTSRATLGFLAVNEEPLTTNQGLASFVCSEKIDCWFLYYLLHFFMPKIKSLGSGSTFPEIGRNSLKKFEIVIAPKDEQIKIRDILLEIDQNLKKIQNHKDLLKANKKTISKNYLKNV